MNARILTGAGIDYESGVRRFAGVARLYEKSHNKFPQDATFARLRADYESGDAAQLRLDAHEFKGMCGNISLQNLYRASEALLALFRADAWAQNDLDAAFAGLERAYNETVQAIREAAEVGI